MKTVEFYGWREIKRALFYFDNLKKINEAFYKLSTIMRQLWVSGTIMLVCLINVELCLDKTMDQQGCVQHIHAQWPLDMRFCMCDLFFIDAYPPICLLNNLHILIGSTLCKEDILYMLFICQNHKTTFYCANILSSISLCRSIFFISTDMPIQSKHNRIVTVNSSAV